MLIDIKFFESEITAQIYGCAPCIVITNTVISKDT